MIAENFFLVCRRKKSKDLKRFSSSTSTNWTYLKIDNHHNQSSFSLFCSLFTFLKLLSLDRKLFLLDFNSSIASFISEYMLSLSTFTFTYSLIFSLPLFLFFFRTAKDLEKQIIRWVRSAHVEELMLIDSVGLIDWVGLVGLSGVGKGRNCSKSIEKQDELIQIKEQLQFECKLTLELILALITAFCDWDPLSRSLHLYWFTTSLSSSFPRFDSLDSPEAKVLWWSCKVSQSKE